MELRGTAISYSSHKNKLKNIREQELLSNIKKIEQNLNESKLEELENYKTELYSIRQENLKGSMIRSKAKDIDQGEKPTKYFCNLEKHNFISKTMTQLQKDDGTVISEQQEILKEAENFYKTLYQSRDSDLEDIDLEEYVKINDMKTLSDDQANNLEGLLTYEEISKTLYNMKNEKSPGISGFAAEFFKVFWKDIGQFVLRSLNYGYIKGELSISQKQGVITCIPKENKPKLYLKNWRPITLLDTVYKIASGSIANRIKPNLDSLIDKDQTGFIQGRYMGENTRLLYDLIHHTEQKEIPGLLLLIDFEKAFDSLSWSFIRKALKFLNFGESFRRWIDVFYKGISSAVIQCGHLSSWFQIGRGCRQGDPLSPYIFIICAEFLSTKLRKNKNIKGIKIELKEFKISQFADDTTVILDGSDDSLNHTLEELEKFSKISGLKINYDKTQIVWIGSKKYSSDTIKTKWKLSWGKDTFKLLGINFNTDLDKMAKGNYTEKIKLLGKTATQWQRRMLSPLGKVTVIKTMLIPTLNHLFITLPNPSESIVNEINNILFTFLWNKKTKLKTSICVKQYSEGGLKMINIKAFIDALKLTWLRRLITYDSKWQHFIKSYIDLNKLMGCHLNYIEHCKKSLKNPFWVDVLNAFIKINSEKVLNEDQVLKCPLFYNNNIKVGGTHIYYTNWYKKGIKYINDLIKEDGEFYTLEEFIETTGIQTNHLQYYGTLRAIKLYLKYVNVKINSKNQNPIIPNHIHPLLKQKKGSQAMYHILNQNKDIPTGKLTWNKAYNFTDEDWAKIYALPFETTKHSAVRWFQISINHKILVTNKILHNMKVRNDALCYYCHSCDESINHLFWSCDRIQTFIKKVTGWLNAYGIDCSPTEKWFIFGWERGKTESKILNFILLYTKYYIYCTRCNQQSLFLEVFKRKLLFMYKTHMEIAINNNDLTKFEKEWSQFLPLVNSIDA